jgi:hypothetical protein
MGKSSVLSIHQRAVLKGCRKHRESLVVECSGHWTTSEDTCGRDSRTELGVTTELGGGGGRSFSSCAFISPTNQNSPRLLRDILTAGNCDRCRAMDGDGDDVYSTTG